MMVSINGRWKLLVGYYLQNKITAIAQAELIKSALNHDYDSGLNVCSVTCDGAYTNFSATVASSIYDTYYNVSL